MLYYHTLVFWGTEGLGEGCVKITLIVSCLEWLTCLFLFIVVEFEKVPHSPDLKMVLVFPVTKVFQKGAMFKWVNVQLSHMCVMQWSVTSVVAWEWVCAATLSPRKIGSPVKITFWWFLFTNTLKEKRNWNHFVPEICNLLPFNTWNVQSTFLRYGSGNNFE